MGIKYLILSILLSGCYYNDLECPNKIRLRIVNDQLKKEVVTMQKIQSQPWDDNIISQITEQADIIELLEIEKFILESSPCQ